MDTESASIDNVAAKLEDLIISGKYKPGQKLREQSLGVELGVGRGPIREAIRTLEGRRLLKRTPHSGVQVVGASIEDLEQLLIAREALEGMTARLSAENMTTAEVEALRQAIHAMETRPKEVAKGVWTSADDDFHRLIAHGSRHHWLEQVLMRDLYSLLRIHLFRAATRPDLSETVKEHKAIVDRIHARDGDGAETAMREHIRRARKRTLASVKATRNEVP
jgi:DNA-binding GntR family transcriptional regulator